MHTLHFGTSTEFVELRRPTTISLQSWAQAQVSLSVRGFQGAVEPFFDKGDFVVFLRELRALSQSLRGTAVLQPLDAQLVVRLSVNAVGHLLVQGEAWSQATFGNRLTFSFELDQTFLQKPLCQLESIVAVWAEDIEDTNRPHR